MPNYIREADILKKESNVRINSRLENSIFDRSRTRIIQDRVQKGREVRVRPFSFSNPSSNFPTDLEPHASMPRSDHNPDTRYTRARTIYAFSRDHDFLLDSIFDSNISEISHPHSSKQRGKGARRLKTKTKFARGG